MLVPIESTRHHLIVGSEISVNEPFSLLHEWVSLVLSQKIYSVASLAPNVGQFLILNPLHELLLWKQWLPHLDFLIKHLTAESMVDTVIYNIVSHLVMLSSLENSHND